MSKTTEHHANTDVIGKALANRQPRRRRMAREAKPADKTPGVEHASPKEAALRPESKIAGVIALLKRGEGATLEELIQATGWLPHTTRAALTGLRKKGHVLAKDKRGEMTCYRIAGTGK